MYNNEKGRQEKNVEGSEKTPKPGQNGPQNLGDKTPELKIIKKVPPSIIAEETDKETGKKEEPKDPDLGIPIFYSECIEINEGEPTIEKPNKNEPDTDKDGSSINSFRDKLTNYTKEAQLSVQKFIQQNDDVNFRYGWMFDPTKVVSYYEFYENYAQKDPKTKLFLIVRYINNACEKYTENKKNFESRHGILTERTRKKNEIL